MGSKNDKNNEFMRHVAEKAWDTIQLAQIKALEECLLDYAANAWRDIHQFEPPIGVYVLGVGEPGENVLVLIQTQTGEWRTGLSQPHKPPTLWMPCPDLPGLAKAPGLTAVRPPMAK